MIFRFFDICLLRAGPQDLPSSLFLLRLTVVVSTVVGVLLNLPNEDVAQSIAISLFNVVFVSVFLYVSLKLRNRLARFRQSLTALMGTSIIIGMVMMPFIYALVAARVEGSAAPVALQFFLLLLVWDITVFAHIMRHSLDIRFAYGFLLSLAYLVLSWMLIDIIFAA